MMATKQTFWVDLLFTPRWSVVGPVADWRLSSVFTPGDGSPHPAYRYPAALLDLLWAVLGDDAQQWPYRIKDVLARPGENTVVGSDPRLAELRRRRQR